ncbi:ABC transporter substrate-binding protein [Campylobacter curvus]|uniref:ABC transporter substrate-binding protein n=1 Tax=Campylobacter curvus TaxID=200 RepID=UPI00146FF09B|nr:ABC transporter substrate-binding protein [Campylobacter curvus]
MKRREFLALNAALGASAFAPSLFAKESFEMWGAPAIPSVIMAVASQQGELAKSHDVSLKIWRSPDQLRAGVANGTIKVTMAPSNVGVNLANQGLNFAMLNILTTGLLNILVKDEKIKSLEDLVGKKFVMPFKNDMPDLIVQALCKKRGLDFNKLNITYAQTPPEAIGMFLQKDFDAVLSVEPMSSAAILRGKKSGIEVIRSFELPKVWGETFNTKPFIPQAGIIVNLEFYEQNRPLFDTLDSDLKNALAWILANKQSAAEIGANYLPAPVPALANSFERSNLAVIKASEISDELMSFFEILFELNPKVLGGKMAEKRLFL